LSSNELKLEVPSGFVAFFYILGLLADAGRGFEQRNVGEAIFIFVFI